MKNLSIIFLLLLPVMVMGQNIGVGSYPATDNVFLTRDTMNNVVTVTRISKIDDSTTFYKVRRMILDTIPVVMLVSDTSQERVALGWEADTMVTCLIYNYFDVSFMFGYELIRMPEYWYSDPISGYLDDKKKLLSKSIIVWQSKRR